jgi:hypothetical protein
MKNHFLLIPFIILSILLTSCASEIEKEAKEICECAEKAEKENREDLRQVCTNLYIIYFKKHKNDKAALDKVEGVCGIN